MGPQHPSTHGVLRLELVLDGEMVVRATPDIGYLHTGMEKLFEYKKYQQGIVITDRMDYLNPLGNNLAYALAVERLFDCPIPERAQVARVLLAELTRINSHLVWLGTTGLDLGASSLFLYAFREREVLLDLFEEMSGARMMTSFIRPGGLFSDLTSDWLQKVRDFLNVLPARIDEYEALLTDNPLFKERTIGIGVLKTEDALAFGVSGPMLRASGVPHDLRKTNPYSGYERFSFETPTRSGGDCYDRYVVRIAELRESIKLCHQALDNLPEGPVRTPDRKVMPPTRAELQHSMEALIHHFKLYTEGYHVPAGDVYVATESPKGEFGVYLVADGTNKPYRCKIRAPGFAHLQAMDFLCRGHMLADVSAVIGSLDIVFGEVDR
ncbi:MAG: NADH-quinone oxidoreductase subunit D [Microvirga sp.]